MPKLKLVVTQNSVTLTGTDAGTNLTGFNLYRSTVSGGPYPTKVNAALIPVAAAAPQLNYTDTTVTAGVTYYYVATAVNQYGESAYSNEEKAVVPVPQTYVLSTQPAGTSLAFGLTVGGPTPLSQSVAIISTPAAAVPIAVSADQPWLSAIASSPTTKTSVAVTVNPAGLAPGTYNGNVVVTNSDGTATNSPFKVPVVLTITGTVPPPPVIS